MPQESKKRAKNKNENLHAKEVTETKWGEEETKRKKP